MQKNNSIILIQNNKIGNGLLFLLCCLVLPVTMVSQTSEPWVRFCDNTQHCGYKDLQGNIKVPAIFNTPFMASPDTFYNIVAVSEKTNQYYLLKNGKKVGVDSVFTFEMAYDCEQEEKIRFHDHSLNRVGFLDKHGQPVIPAIYNYALPFRNGLSLVGYGATYTCIDEFEGADTPNCEHYAWVGGVKQIINDKNEILIDSIDWEYKNLDWYSLRTNMPNPDTALYYTITGRQGVRYSFLDYDKEFKRWFYNVFMPAVENGKNLKVLIFEEVRIRNEQLGRLNIHKDDFLSRFPFVLTPQRFQENELKEISVRQTKFNLFSFNTPIFRKFYNSCGYQEDRFPVFEVSITYKKGRQQTPVPDNEKRVMPPHDTEYRENFEFLRTEHGYQLVRASFRE